MRDHLVATYELQVDSDELLENKLGDTTLMSY